MNVGWSTVEVSHLDVTLGLVRCPECAGPLDRHGDGVACAEDHAFPLVAGDVPDLAIGTAEPKTLGQRAMRFQPLVDVYESTWRPLFTTAAGGIDPDAETAELLEWLDVDAEATLVDIACGTGNTTRRLAVGTPAGTVVGFDLSVPMLTQATTRTPDTAAIGFARVDAHRLPLEDSCIDGAHCAAALYLFDDPGAVIGEVGRVLRPDASLAGMTLVSPVQPFGPIGRYAQRISRALSGLHYAGPEEISEWCAAAGLVDFHEERRGAALLFSARRPAA